MKYCSQCGSQQDDSAVFCNKCGCSFNGGVIPPQTQQFRQPTQQFQQPQFQQPQFQQPQYAQPGVQGGAAAPNGSRKKLFIIIGVTAAVVIVTLLILFLFVFKSKKDLIVGTWLEIKENGNGDYTRFYKDGTVDLVVGKDAKATYKIDGDTLIITRESISRNYDIVELTEDKMTLKQTYGGMTVEVSFKKVDDKGAYEAAGAKADLKTANTNAKLIYTVLNSEASDRIADGMSVNAVKTDGPVAVESLKDSADPLKAAVYKEMAQSDSAYGYVYIDFDPSIDYYTDASRNFVQWSDSKDGIIIGQYPDPIKTAEDSDSAVFGKRYTS